MSINEEQIKGMKKAIKAFLKYPSIDSTDVRFIAMESRSIPKSVAKEAFEEFNQKKRLD